MDAFITVLLLALTCYIYYLWDIYSYWRKRNVVGPTPWPIVGNYGPVLIRTSTEKELVQKIYSDYPNETYIGFFIGTTPILMVKDPQAVKLVLNKDFNTFSDRFVSFAARDFDKNIFTIPGDENWKLLRKLVSPPLNKAFLSVLEPRVSNATKTYLDYVDEVIASDTEQNLLLLKNKYGQKIVSDVMLGVDLGSFEEESEFMRKAHIIEVIEAWELKRILENVFPKAMKVVKFLSNGIARRVYSFYSSIILSAVHNRENKEIDTVESYIDFFLNLKQKTDINSPVNIDDDHIVQNMLTFTVAYVETVSLTMAFMGYKLALNQEAQRKCYDEISQVLEKCNGVLTIESISEMKYLEMVLDETLRMAEISFVLDKFCQSKYRFPDTNFWIDKGVYVYIPVDAMHTDEKYFPEPEKFIPERFSPENKAKIPPYVYLPFSGGPRQCVGKKFARIMIMYGVAAFLQRFKVTPTESTPKTPIYERSIRIKSIVGGLPLAIQKRTWEG